MDTTTDVPREVRGWNWGAFLLNWIWAIGNRCYVGLLTFVPFVGLVVPFVLGFKGNEWAWRNGQWQSVAAFQRTQRRWTQAALLTWAGAIVGAVALFFVISASLQRTAAFELAQALIASDPEVTRTLGAPLRMGRVGGSVKKAGSGSGEAELSFPVTGSLRSAKAYVGARERADRWSLEHLELVFDDGRHLVLTQTTRSALSAAPAATPAPPPVQPPQPVTLASRHTDIHGSLARKLVATAFDSQLQGLAPCFEHGATPATEQTLRLTIAPTGAVQSATLEGSTLDSSSDACIRRTAEQFQFPKPKSGMAVVRHTFLVQR
jgi:hypothetical protein